MTMMAEGAASNMKFGIVISRELDSHNELFLMPLVERLSQLGCTAQNIIVKRVPTTHDVLMATLFLAEYTDCDGVIILAPKQSIMEHLPLMNGIVQIQTQWNMVVEIGGIECADNIVEMITLQNDMELEAPEMLRQRGAGSIS